MENVGKAKIIQLESLSELIRLVVSNSQQRSGYLYFGKKDGKNIFLVTHLVPSWYEMRGLPITMYATYDSEPLGAFIAYSKNENDEEHYEFVNKISDNPKYMNIPIIKMKEIPDFIFM